MLNKEKLNAIKGDLLVKRLQNNEMISTKSIFKKALKLKLKKRIATKKHELLDEL